MFLLALAAWILLQAWRRPRHRGWWAASGAVLALLALTKAVFTPFALVVAALALVRARLVCAVALGAMLVLPVGGWAWRNHALFGATSDGRGAIALSTREVFDHMRPDEHAAAFLWWTRGPGDDLAKRFLPEEAWRRHEWYEPDGFYNQGQVVRHQHRVDRLMVEQGLSAARAEAAAATVVLSEIAARWPAWLATMPALFYRGLWVDEFIVFGFPALVWLTWHMARGRRWEALVAVAPGWWSLLVYPAISLNIPRYQLTAIPALAIAAGLVAQVLWRRWRPHESVAKSPALG